MEMMETIEIHFSLHPAIIPWYLGVPVSARCRAISVRVVTSRDSESIMRPGVNIETVKLWLRVHHIAYLHMRRYTACQVSDHKINQPSRPAIVNDYCTVIKVVKKLYP